MTSRPTNIAIRNAFDPTQSVRSEQKAAESTKRAENIKHDPLHDFDVLEYCWCICAKCWNKKEAKCKCRTCPCRFRPTPRSISALQN